MNIDLVLIRNLLYKWFVIGFVLYIISILIFLNFKDYAAQIACILFYVDPYHYFQIALALFGLVKLLLFFFVLTPALSIHWFLSKQKK